MTNVKGLSAAVFWLQVALFASATVYLVWGFNNAIVDGGGFVPGFEGIMLGRLTAWLAPYLLLPVSMVLSRVLYRSGKYATAMGIPFIFLGFAIVAGQIYLRAVPDPIEENFGTRPAPYEGFLVLLPDAVPAGFQETSHHYTKQEYAIDFTRMLNGERIGLDIIESPVTQFVYREPDIVRQFTYRGIPGRVYASYNDRTTRTTLSLVWLNPPRQRIAISLTQTRDKDYSPDDVIKILESMKPAEQQR